MLSKKFILISLSLILVLSGGCSQEKVTPTPKGTLEGYIYAPLNAQRTEVDLRVGKTPLAPAGYVPLAQAKVELEGTEYSTHTEANGYFKMTGIASGTYTVIISADGYQMRRIEGIVIKEGNITKLGEPEVIPILPLPRKWTVMIYLDADNDLESFGALDDIPEMEKIGSSGEVNVVVQWDGLKGIYGMPSSTKRYYIFPGHKEELQSLGELNMGDPQTLWNFIGWAMSTYPAEYYLLVIWDHGNGWRGGTASNFKGIAFDFTSGDYLHLNEFPEAFSGYHLDIVSFDGCLMGLAEVTYQLRDYADYVVASPELVPADGWPYDDILKDLVRDPDLTPLEISEKISDLYVTSYGIGGSQAEEGTYPAILSVYDLSYMDELAQVTDSFVSLLMGYPELVTGSYYEDIEDDRQTYNFIDPGYPQFSTLADYYHFAQLVENWPQADFALINRAKEVMDTIDKVVSYTISRDDSYGDTEVSFANSHGLAIYLNWTDEYNYIYSSSHDFANDTRWDEFCQWLDSVAQNRR